MQDLVIDRINPGQPADADPQPTAVNLQTPALVDGEAHGPDVVLAPQTGDTDPPDASRPDGWIEPERLAVIDDLLRDARRPTGHQTNLPVDPGTRLAQDAAVAALAGADETLGELSVAEQEYLTQSYIEAVTNGMDPVERNISMEGRLSDLGAVAEQYELEGVATGLANSARGVLIENEAYGQPNDHNRDFAGMLLERAVRLDPLATVRAFEGFELDLAEAAMRDLGRDDQVSLLLAIADGEGTVGGADTFTATVFGQATPSDLENDRFRSAMTQALARTVYPGESEADRLGRQSVSERLDELLENDGVRQLLFGEGVPDHHRAWALGHVVNDSSLDVEALDQGWESQEITALFADEALANLPDFPQGIEPTDRIDISNYVGMTLGIQPSAEALEGAAENGFGQDLYADQDFVSDIADTIEDNMGEGSTLSVVSVAVTTENGGPSVLQVYRIDHPGGEPTFVDMTGRASQGLGEWMSSSTLPRGQMVIPEGMRPGAELETPQNTPDVPDTGWEKFWDAADTVATVVGVTAFAVAGGAAIFFSGGSATPAVIGAASWLGTGATAYHLARTGAEGIDAALHGEDIWDLTEAANRQRALGFAADAVSLGAFGSAIRATGIRNAVGGADLSDDFVRNTALWNRAAFGVDTVVAGDTAATLYAQWDQLSEDQRMLGLMNLAFTSGQAGLSATNVGGLRGLVDQGAAENFVRYATPFRVEITDSAEINGVQRPLADDTIMVGYEDLGNGRLEPVIYAGSAEAATPEAIARHSFVARQIDRIGGLSERFEQMWRGPADGPEPGTAAWEAQLDIQKISRERDDVIAALNAEPNDPSLNRRLEELDTSIREQELRLLDVDGPGQGWIGDSTTGNQQAREMFERGELGGLDTWEPPDGHTWVAGRVVDGVREPPHLRRLDGEGDHYRYNPETGLFVNRAQDQHLTRSELTENGLRSYNQGIEGEDFYIRSRMNAFEPQNGSTLQIVDLQNGGSRQGIDAVEIYRDADGNIERLVFVEVKTSRTNDYRLGGGQSDGGEEFVDDVLREMAGRTGRFQNASPEQEQLAQNLLREIDLGRADVDYVIQRVEVDDEGGMTQLAPLPWDSAK